MSKANVSTQTIDEALKIAKGTAKPGQTKEQTKIIAQGIEKGIAEYKKREKAKARERDKARKKQRTANETDTEVSTQAAASTSTQWLPWVLLAVSWVGFLAFEFLR